MTEKAIGLMCLSCEAVDHSELEGEFWPRPITRDSSRPWECPRCGSGEYAGSLVRISDGGEVRDESGRLIAVKLIKDRPYLVAYKPHQTQARLVFVGRAHDMLHWKFQDGPRDLILRENVIEWIEEGRT
jgi:hypothetical protein